MSSVVVLARYFESDPEKTRASLERLRHFCFFALTAGAKHVLVAVNAEKDVSNPRSLNLPKSIEIFPVTPWGHFVLPLNALLIKGRAFWANNCRALTASIEVPLTREIVETLKAHMDKSTFVVGAALEGHLYKKGIYVYATGRQHPWGTLALWNAEMLYKYGGFHLLGDGPPDAPECAGVEELVTTARAQGFARRENAYAKAKLIQIPGVQWETNHFDGERLKKHEEKMRSKNERPVTQLLCANLPAPTVVHC